MQTPQTDRPAPAWRKSSRSTSGNQCVEVAVLPAGSVGVRDSKKPDTGMHAFSPAGWSRFLADVRAGRVA